MTEPDTVDRTRSPRQNFLLCSMFCLYEKHVQGCCPARQRTALLNAGLLSKTDDGMIVFPYDAIHVGFMLKAA